MVYGDPVWKHENLYPTGDRSKVLNTMGSIDLSYFLKNGKIWPTARVSVQFCMGPEEFSAPLNDGNVNIYILREYGIT